MLFLLFPNPYAFLYSLEQDNILKKVESEWIRFYIFIQNIKHVWGKKVKGKQMKENPILGELSL